MNDPTQKPDPTEFAREVLYHLAALSAEVREVKYLLCDEMADSRKIPPEQVRERYAEFVTRLTGKLYDDSKEAARIPPADGPTIPDVTRRARDMLD